MKAPRRLNGSRIAVGAASVGLTVGAFSLYSRKRYGRSAANRQDPRSEAPAREATLSPYR